MNVLSLFDGISGAKVALDALGICTNKYFASEIDQGAITVTVTNHPSVIQLGDVTKLPLNQLPKIDLLIGGSPCQGFSRSGKGGNFDDPRSALVQEYAKIKYILNPKYFLLENVKSMKKEWKDEISRMVGCEPIMINSKYFSAQKRERLYWTNIPVDPYVEKETIFYKDVKENLPKVEDTYFLPPITVRDLPIYEVKFNKEFYILGDSDQVPTLSTKYTLSRERFYGISDPRGIRVLSILERERLQGFPDHYTQCVPKTSSFELVGNSFQVDTLVWVLKNLRKNP